MKNRFVSKLRSRQGVSILVALLLAAIAVLLVIIAIPAVQAFREKMDVYGCELALRKVQNTLDREYTIAGFTELTEEQVAEITEQLSAGRENVCPSGGDFHAVQDSSREQTLTAVCSLHNTDKKLCTRLNAKTALRQLRDAVAHVRQFEDEDPETVTVTVNSQPLPAQLVAKRPELHRGTFSTPGYEGTVLYYMLDGTGVSYFCYADPDHCALWTPEDAWTGDSYS